MPIQEISPADRRAVRARFNAVFFEDVPYRLATDLRDAQFAKLADYSNQAETRFFGDRQDQLTKLFGFPLAALGILRLRSAVLVSHPVVERRR